MAFILQPMKQFFIILLIAFPFFLFSQENIDLLILNKKFDQALIELDKQLSIQPSANLYLKKGLVHQNLQDYQKALEAFTSGLQYEPKNIDLLSQSAECFALLGNNFDAIKYYEDAIALAPENLTMAAKLGRVHINLKDYKKAYEVFANIYQNDSLNVYWNKQLAYCSFRVNRRKQAAYLYEKVIEANPRDFGTYNNLAHCYSFKKERPKILEVINRGLEQFPNNPEMLADKADFYYKSREYEKAMIEFDNYFKAGGDSIFELLSDHAICTYLAKDEEKAFKKLNRLFAASPQDPFIQYYLSLCYKNMNNYPEAEKYMKWAIQSSLPTYVDELYHHLGQIYGQQRKFKESVEALQKSYELNPKNHEVLFEIATTFEEFNSNKTLALNYYRIYLKEAGEGADNINYALDRISKIKEDLFFEE